MITTSSPGSVQVPRQGVPSGPRTPEPRSGGRSQNRFVPILANVAASRQARLFGAVWLAAAATLVVTGQGFSALDGALFGLAYLGFSLVTVAITEPKSAQPASSTRRPRVWVQLGIVALFVTLTAWRGLGFHDVVGPEATMPLWSPLVDTLQRAGDRWFGNGNFVANPVLYVGIPLPLLLLAGARLRSLGFGAGHRTTRVLLLWSAVPLAVFGYALIAGVLAPGVLIARVISNTLNNGFFEEFLFRGALQTRLRGLVGPSSALILQALVFGVWHLGLGFTETGHVGLVPALASTVAHQAIIGLAFGILFERTRNLLAPSVAHVLINSMY
jgi:membrane protease YdiL (CAAX protease family)